MSTHKRNGFRAGFPEQEDGRMTKAKNVVTDENGRILRVKDITSALQYLEKFFDVTELVDGKTKKYVTRNGFSHPEYVQTLPSQGLVKTILAAFKILCDRAVTGDEESVKLVKMLSRFLEVQKDHSRTEALANLKDAQRVLESAK